MKVILTIKEDLPAKETYLKIGRLISFTISDQNKVFFERYGIIKAEVNEKSLEDNLDKVLLLADVEYDELRIENE